MPIRVEAFLGQVICRDCCEFMQYLSDACVDAVITDPPYGLKFMGKKWDYDVPGVDAWRECFRILKPGGHLLSFFGTRTYHRGVVNIEDAGFEIRDQIGWLYGSGFPKSLDVSKAIDKAAGKKGKVVREKRTPDGKLYSNRTPNSSGNYNKECAHNTLSGKTRHNNFITAPATEAARQWNGWGTALKPAHEPIVVARKPIEGTVAENVLKHGTGAMNIDGCRIEFQPDENAYEAGIKRAESPRSNFKSGNFHTGNDWSKKKSIVVSGMTPQGRWPANIIHDGSEEVLAGFPIANSARASGNPNNPVHQDIPDQLMSWGGKRETHDFRDKGSAARFFYCAKASKADRGEGNDHPTVKPTALMRYLCRLVTPPGGIILDPFAGSGSTGKAAILEGFSFICIDSDPHACEIARRRLADVHKS